MGIFGALITSVAGLQAQSFALENIAGNIANSQTTAFKRNDTSFADMVIGGTPKLQTSGSVTMASRSTNSLQGDLQASSVDTFMAINGDGFFAVQKPGSFVDGSPVFDGVNLYTRRGDFELNEDGYLVNGSGYYLLALKIDPATGNPAGSIPGVIQLQNDFMPAQATTTIDYRANLATFPRTEASDPDVPGSELIGNWYTVGSDITGADESRFLEQTVSGGAVTAYDVNGSAVNVQFRWAKSADNTWQLFYQSNSQAGAADVAWTLGGQDFTFDDAGKLLSPATTTIGNVAVNGITVGDIRLDYGTDGLTQFADSNGTVSINRLSQNGYPAGDLVNVTVDDGGGIVANYSNGRTATIAQIPLYSFYSPNGLQKLDGGAFAETAASGTAIVGAGGQIVSKTLEGSNTDIADEFTRLIVTQQAYAANTRVVTTANEMLQQVLQMGR